MHFSKGSKSSNFFKNKKAIYSYISFLDRSGNNASLKEVDKVIKTIDKEEQKQNGMKNIKVHMIQTADIGIGMRQIGK